MTELGSEEKLLDAALFHFIFPFSLNKNCKDKLISQLQMDGFTRFSLKNTALESEYYGDDYRVSHLNLERYYLPFTNSMIFPHTEDKPGLHRYSKKINQACTMRSEARSIGFIVQSTDVFLCPFDLGFITIRVEIPRGTADFSEAMEFAKRFRVLQDMNSRDREVSWVSDRSEYEDVEDFLFKHLVPGIVPFMNTKGIEETYFARHPFFVDERMYIQGLIAFQSKSEITEADLFRASHIDGFDGDNQPYMSSTNPSYIARYLDKHVYDRWAPHTYYITHETSFVCVTNEEQAMRTRIANHMYGEYYYALIINLFHKIVLLKLSNLYSHIRLDENKDKIEQLIRSITTFSAKYYFNEVVSQTQGKEIFIQLRSQFGNIDLFTDVKQTLADLYKYQENFTTKRSNYLLLILTIYTVISGIYGMNQVIEDLKGDIDWGKMQEYSPFEYFAFALTLSGITVALWLGVTTIYQLIKEMIKKHQYNK